MKTNKLIFGSSYTLNPKLPLPLPYPLELLVVYMPKKYSIAYLKYNLLYNDLPGKLIIGIYKDGNFDLKWPKKGKAGTKDKVIKCTIQGVEESTVHIKNLDIDFKFGFKIAARKIGTLQTAIDSNFKWTSAFTYNAIKKLNFVLSSQLDFAKFVNNPKGGFYDYGFTVDFLF